MAKVKIKIKVHEPSFHYIESEIYESNFTYNTESRSMHIDVYDLSKKVKFSDKIKFDYVRVCDVGIGYSDEHGEHYILTCYIPESSV